MKENSLVNTPLAIALAGRKGPQATPLDAFKLARKHWLQGKRVSVGELAKELGVSRGKVYRWVGHKDLLLDEILWSLAKPTFEQAVKDTPGNGVDHIVSVHRRFMNDIISFKPLRQFIDHDPAYALRVLTKGAVGTHERIIKAAALHIAQQAAQGYIQLPASADKLAEIIIRTNEALFYNDMICGQNPDIERACTVSRILLSAGKIF
ncbi:MAG: QsdR family transcriptional regulator [Desulfobacteraceae bacterium]|nr:QsdR family transcriptional regulator [Desulfobacteraceae bacterium]